MCLRRSVLMSFIRANQQSQLWAVYEADYECDSSTCMHQSSDVLGIKKSGEESAISFGKKFGGQS